MKRIFGDFVYILYKYYEKGSTSVIAYESGLLAISFIILIDILSIAKICNISIDIGTDDKITKYLIFATLLIPIYMVFMFIYPKIKLISEERSSSQIRNSKYIFIIIVILSVIGAGFAIKS